MSLQSLTIQHILIGAECGGCERNSYFLCKYLHDTRHSIIVLGERGPMTERWEALGTPTRHLNILNEPRLLRTRKLREALLHMRSDGVIIWHGMVELPILLHVLPLDCGPVLVHGGNPAHTMTWGTNWRYLLAEWLWPPRHNAMYVCCSSYVLRSFDSSHYLRRFRRCVITNGIDEAASASLHSPRPLPSGVGEIVIGMLARLDLIKDHVTLIRALTEVKKTFPGVRLEIAGDGEQAGPLRALALELGLAAQVKFLGMVSDVFALLPSWDIFAYATTPREGFGNAVAEALMCGLPVILSDTGPMREVCGSGTEATAVYVPPFDPVALAAALITLVSDLPRRRDLASRGRQRAMNELHARVFAERYAQLLASERRIPSPT
jgi:glycosyltransferase involved in cell wall biosynthesis